MPSRKKIRRQLETARDEQTMVRITRRPKHADRIQGFVVGVGERWAVLHQTEDGGYFDGHTAFLIRDVERILKDKSFAPMMTRTLDEWPPKMPAGDFDLGSVAGVVRGLAKAAPLLGIEKEHERRATWIGTLDEVGQKWVWLHEVRPNATWHKRPLGYKLKAITKVQTGNRYMRALAQIAGPPPEA